MRARCNNPNNGDYHNYGGIGITVDPRWEKFENFQKDMGERPKGMTIDRIDNNGPYSPDNCRWATAKTQARNRRGSIYIEYMGEKITLVDLSKITGIPYPTVWHRHKKGYDAAKIVDGWHPK